MNDNMHNNGTAADGASTSGYPTRDDHTRQWEELAREIAAARHTLSEDTPPVSPDKKGSLIILGSGIQGIGFTMDAEAYIRMADKVFYCVSNPPTQVWLRKLRPDAYDLYVLYDDTKPRYHTYMQMSEAMLHCVRKGENVVTIFYGHPGIFVLSTHRAIEIARREGHYAVMKPGISALDCLCADLGVDPSYPGMQTYEATEALIRQRPLDTTSHVVLWQVGLIGEMGYRRKGFINDKFPILVEYLQKHYGEDYEITHYVAARHPTFEPTMAVHKLSEMLDPRIRATFTGISTFYIPPKDVVQTDMEMAVRLGIFEPGQKPSPLSRIRKIGKYSQRELDAFEEMENFRVPAEYQYQPLTRAAEFLVELNQNIPLQELYRDSPKEAVSGKSFPGLSPIEQYLLGERNEDLAQLAAKGSLVPISPNERFIIDLHQKIELAGAFRAELAATYLRDDAEEAIDAWITSKGYKATLNQFLIANARLNASMVLPWTGVYASSDGSLVLTVIGNPYRNVYSQVYANLTRINNFTIHDATLTWRAEDDNPNSAILEFAMPEQADDNGFLRSLSGICWNENQERPAEDNVHAVEVTPGEHPLSVWTGEYATQVTKDGSTWESGPTVTIVTPRPDGSGAQSYLLVNGEKAEGATFEGRTISWGSNQLTMLQDTTGSGGKGVTGSLDGYWSEGINVKGTANPNYATPFYGTYHCFSPSEGSQWKPNKTLSFDADGIRFDGESVEGATFEGNSIAWSNAGGGNNNGRIMFFIDPTTGLPKCTGFLWGSGSQPENPNVVGVCAITDSSSEGAPSGRYTTSLQLADNTFGPGGPILEVHVTDGSNCSVTLVNGDSSTEISNPTFDAGEGVLSWSGQTEAGNFADATIRFGTDPLTGFTTFEGKFWSAEGTEPEGTNWLGHSIGVHPSVPVGGDHVPARVWEILGTLGLEGSHPGIHLIWSRWQRAVYTCRLINSFAKKFCEAIADEAIAG